MDNLGLAAKSFIVKNNKILIIKRSPTDIHQPGMWELPGGILKVGEDPIEGVKRETKEETGVDIEILHMLNRRRFTTNNGQAMTMLVFLSRALDDKIKIGKEHSDFAWVPLSNCKEKLDNFFHKEVDIFNKLELHKHI